ncbi:MAG: hypothetical protein DRQ57_15375 [Gammaproteobacteria bacterium]|nr:MAG: hypothetical protein DRQ57_15375 [Gammaproteobacteria bacterium]
MENEYLKVKLGSDLKFVTFVPHKQHIYLIEQMVSLPAYVQSIAGDTFFNKPKIKTINTIIKQVDAMITITSIMKNKSTDLHDIPFYVEYEIKLKEAYLMVIESLTHFQNELRCEKGHFLFKKKTKKLIRKIGRLKSNITLFQKNIERYFTADSWDIEMCKDAEAGLLDEMAEWVHYLTLILFSK